MNFSTLIPILLTYIFYVITWQVNGTPATQSSFLYVLYYLRFYVSTGYLMPQGVKKQIFHIKNGHKGHQSSNLRWHYRSQVYATCVENFMLILYEKCTVLNCAAIA